MSPSIAHIPASDEYFEGILPVDMLLCFHTRHPAGAERLWGGFSGAADAVKVDNIDYDYNGNIKSLNRKDLLGSGLDQLTYDYGTGINQSNKLISVSDAGNLEKGFKDGHTGCDDYFYDANGNMNEDKNKGILFISYNHLNLPDSMNMGDGKAIKYTK